MTVVQRTPNLGIGIKLQRLPEAEKAKPCPPCPCPCAPATVGWAIQPTPGKTYLYPDPNSSIEYERHRWNTPILVDAYINDPDGNSDTNAAGRPVILRMATLPMYGDFTPATPPAYTNPHQSWLFLGLPFGDANAIRWEWTWDISADLPTEPASESSPEDESWWAGEKTEQVGNFLQVRILHGYYDVILSGDWSATLTAKAYCGENEVGKLVLKIEMVGQYNY